MIAVIAILAALLLPALAAAKSKGRNVSCINNLRQLQICWAIYAGENADRLTPNNSIYDFTTGKPIPGIDLSETWCPGNVRVDVGTSNIEAGLLYSYNRSPRIYRCPADNASVLNSSGAIHTRSYNMSQSVNGHPELKYSPFVSKFSQIGSPPAPRLFVFVDVHEDSILDALFGIPTLPFFVQNQYWDLPAGRHTQGCNLSFADGHIEHWRWSAPKVYTNSMIVKTSAEWKDYWRLQGSVKQKFD